MLWVTTFSLLSLFAAVNLNNAYALTFDEITAAEEYTLEVSQQESVVPPLKLDGNWHYSADIFEYADENYEKPLAEDVTFFTFGKVQKYRLRYTVTEIGGEHREKVLYSLVNAVDTSAPFVDIDDFYEEELALGDSITIYSASVTDNSGEELSYTVKLMMNGKDVSSEIKENKYKTKENGTLEIVYSAEDSSGNEGTAVAKITIGAGSNTKKGCNGSIRSESVVGIFLTISAVVFIHKRRKSDNA